MEEQQVTLTDLDPAQLQEVKKQLDEVRAFRPCRPSQPTHTITGTRPPHFIIRAAQAGAGKVQELHLGH